MKKHFPFKTFVPLFILAAALPILVFSTSSSAKNIFTSQAANEKELRIWLEPANIMIKKGVAAKLKVVALYDSATRSVPYLSGTVTGSPDLAITNAKFEYNSPFSGRVEIGTIEFSSQKPGTYYMSINKDVVTKFPENVDITTTGTYITVK